ncbi:MAG: rsmD [Polaromonas sp.]|nr:rsmD [Polaromonas sp.]
MKYTAAAKRPVPTQDARSGAKPGSRAGNKPGKVVARKSVPPGEVRIIGGQYKRSKLPVADRPGLRPTPDRVRETLFNWLGQDLTGWRCADVFAGTGVLGFEAASRGAADVILGEQDPLLVDKLKALQVKLKATMVRIERSDGVSLLRRLPADSLQLVFIDPPFDSALYAPALKAAAQAIHPTGLVYLEAPKPWADAELLEFGLQVRKSDRAGAVHFHLLERADGTRATAAPDLADAA